MKQRSTHVFNDKNRSGSTFGTQLVLSDSAAEWTQFKNNFGEVSLLAAMNQNPGSGIVTLADLAAWAWENQGGSSLTQTTRGVLFTVPGSNSDNIRQLYLAKPSTDYQLTVKFNMEGFPRAQFKFGGLGHKDVLGAGGKLDLWNFDGRSQVELLNAQYSTQTTYSGQTPTMTNAFAHEIWLRMKVQAGSIYYYYSWAGVEWTLMRSYTLAAGYLGAAGYNYLLIEGNESCAAMEGIRMEILFYELITL